jgi:PhoH-like ATPase
MYTGLREIICCKDEDYATLYEHPETLGLNINEYVLIKDKDGMVIDEKRWTGTELSSLKYKKIKNPYFDEVKPLSPEQKCLFDLLQNNSIIGKLVVSKFGCGKSFVSLVHCLDFVIGNKPQFDKIVFLRNMQLVKDMGNHPLGSLPGELEDKLMPFLMPIADILGSKMQLETLINSEKIVPEFEGFIRGRSYKRSILYCMEAENQTREQMALIMSRVGEGSILIIDGDLNQIDRDVYTRDNGIVAMAEKLKGNKMFGMVKLQKNERSEFSSLSDLLLEK